MFKSWAVTALHMPPIDGAPDAPTFDSNTSLTPGEQAYISSRGADTSGFQPGAGAGAGGPGPDPDKTPPAAAASPPGADQGAEEDDDGDDFEPAGGPAGPVRGPNGQFVKREAFLRVKGKAKAAVTEARAATEGLQQANAKLTTIEQRVAALLDGGVDINQLVSALKAHAQQPPAAAPAAPAQPAAEAKPPIKPEDDIFAFMEQLQGTVQQLQQETKAQKEAREAHEANARRLQTFQQDALAFAAKTPDFPAAYSHLANARGSQLKLMGYTDDQVKAQLEKEELAAVDLAIQRGVSPSQFLYDYAKSFGYAPKAAAPAAPAADRQLQQINDGQRASQTLTGGGTTPAAALSGSELVQKLVQMEQKEFDAFRAKFIAEKGKPAWVQQTGLG